MAKNKKSKRNQPKKKVVQPEAKVMKLQETENPNENLDFPTPSPEKLAEMVELKGKLDKLEEELKTRIGASHKKYLGYLESEGYGLRATVSREQALELSNHFYLNPQSAPVPIQIGLLPVEKS